MIIHGIGASMNMLAPPAASGTVPSGADAHLDFTTGFYSVNGTGRSVGSIIGGNFDAGKIEARGLYISNVAAGQHGPDAIGDLFDLLAPGVADGITLVYEYEIIDDNAAESAFGPHLFWFDNADADLATEYVQTESNGTGMLIQDNAGTILDQLAHNWNEPVAQVQRVAMTYARDIGGGDFEYAASANGETAFTATTTRVQDFTVARVTLFHVEEWAWWPDEWCIRTITVYPVKAPADLPALSTIS